MNSIISFYHLSDSFRWLQGRSQLNEAVYYIKLVSTDQLIGACRRDTIGCWLEKNISEFLRSLLYEEERSRCSSKVQCILASRHFIVRCGTYQIHKCTLNIGFHWICKILDGFPNNTSETSNAQNHYYIGLLGTRKELCTESMMSNFHHLSNWTYITGDKSWEYLSKSHRSVYAKGKANKNPEHIFVSVSRFSCPLLWFYVSRNKNKYFSKKLISA